MVISIDADSADLFYEFASINPQQMKVVNHKSFFGQVDMIDFIVEISPTLISALTSYLIMRIKNSEKKVKIKKDGLEIELTNTNITPEDTIDLLEKLKKI